MPKQLDEFPAEVRDNMPEGAAQIFVAAYNSATEDGMDEQAAMQVAYNSLKPNYEQGPDGKWHFHQASDTGSHKPVQSGGN